MNGMPDVRSELVLGMLIICLVPAARQPWRQTRLKCSILPHLGRHCCMQGSFSCHPRVALFGQHRHPIFLICQSGTSWLLPIPDILLLLDRCEVTALG